MRYKHRWSTCAGGGAMPIEVTKNKGLAIFLTSFVEKLGKTSLSKELNTKFSKALVTF